jgi:4-amino-4-deoxy-L-arabinose transferase-like glycosyltransferase
MRPALGAALFLAVVLPWFALVERRIPEFLHYFVVDQHIARFVGSAAEHPAPLWFFLPVLAFGFFPWIVHVPAAASQLREQRDLSIILWSWFAVIFIFFSVAQEKLMGYILPVYPPLAIIVGGYLARLFEPRQAAEVARRVCRSAIASGAIALILSPVFFVGLRRFMEQDGRLSISEIGVWPWALAAVYATMGAAQIVFGWRGLGGGALVASAVSQALAFVVIIGGAAAADVWLGTRPIGMALSRLAGPDDAIVLYRVPQPSVEYYLDRPPVLFGWTGEHTWGMKVRPNRSYATDDPNAVKDLLTRSRNVWVVTRPEDHADAELGVALQPVMGNRKRTIYRAQRETTP